MSSSVSFMTDDDGLKIGRFLSKIPNVGRKNEVLALNNAYDRVKKKLSFEKVIIRGESGTGKTTLAMSLQEKVLKDGGFFCCGKYFQNSDIGQDPFSAIIAAFSDLCDLMLQSGHCNEKCRAAIKSELGPDAKFLINVVTNISPFLVGDDGKDLNQCNDIMYSEAFASFKLACKTLLRAMSSNEHTIVLFIDDIQWIDPGSKELLESLLCDTTISNVLLILAYRDEYSFYVEDIINCRDETFVDIQIGNFDFQNVNELVCTMLGFELPERPKDMDALCSLIVSRTHGNPFHVKQFVDAIQSVGLLRFDTESSTWVCNVERAQKETMISNSLADLILKKVNRLNREAQTLLKAMSLSPCRFTEDLLLLIARKLLAEVDVGELRSGRIALRALLRKAIQEGMIEETCDGYQFTHDKIRAEFQGIMNKEEWENLHLVLGRIFIAKTGGRAKYLAAVHLNCVTALMMSTEENKLRLAQVNLKASKYCQSRFSFEAARSFVRKGLELLQDKKKWTTNFNLSFEMTRLLAMLESVCGNLGGCIAATSDLLTWAKSSNETVDALLIEIDARISFHFTEDGLEAGKKGLRKIGFLIPNKITPLQLYFKLKKVRKLIDGKKDEEILGLVNHDTEICNAQKLLSRITLYFLQRKAWLLSIYTIILAVEHAMVLGVSSYALISLSYLGAVERFVGKNKRASGVGKLVQKLVALHGNSANTNAVACFTKIFICFPQVTLRRGIHRFTPEDIDRNFQHGEFLYNELVCFISFLIRFLAGENLKSLETSNRQVYYRFRELGQKELLVHFHPVLQVILNLQCRHRSLEDLVVLTGEIMDEEEFSRSMGNVISLKMSFLVTKMILAYILGCYEEAEHVAVKVMRSFPMLKDKLYGFLIFNFYSAMIYYARYHETGRGRYIRRARKNKRFLQKWHSAGVPDANVLLRLVETEEYCVKNVDVTQICNRFDSVINCLRADGLKNLEALANERAYHLLNKLGYCEVSKGYLEEAIQKYKDWGATAKYEWASREYSELATYRI